MRSRPDHEAAQLAGSAGETESERGGQEGTDTSKENYDRFMCEAKHHRKSAESQSEALQTREQPSVMH